jgi:NAD(P)-dependent dehydrogenase (short-subunit alcohol dehydrogenase family)
MRPVRYANKPHVPCGEQLRYRAVSRKCNEILECHGVMATPSGHTADGFETQFGTSHLGQFVLVHWTAPLLRKRSSLINLSSAGHRSSNVDLDDPNFGHTPYETFPRRSEFRIC